jgi:hypothetical protein
MGFDSYTKLVCHFNGADTANTYIAETGQTVTFVADAQLDTAVVKTGFGSSSLALDGSSDYVTVPDTADWDFGSGDFTIEAWFNFSSIAADSAFFSQTRGGAQEQGFYAYRGGAAGDIYFRYRATDGSRVEYQRTANWTPSINTWYHIAFVRNGSSFYMFIDGVSQTMTEVVAIGTKTLYNCDGAFCIGGAQQYSMAFGGGWIDEVRVSKGIARWTTNFPPPTAEYVATDIKRVGGVAYADIKKAGGVALAGIKKIGGLA